MSLIGDHTQAGARCGVCTIVFFSFLVLLHTKVHVGTSIETFVSFRIFIT